MYKQRRVNFGFQQYANGCKPDACVRDSESSKISNLLSARFPYLTVLCLLCQAGGALVTAICKKSLRVRKTLPQ